MNAMGYYDMVGTIGVGLILLSYFCNIFRLITGNEKLFFVLNITGAGLACYASWLLLWVLFFNR